MKKLFSLILALVTMLTTASAMALTGSVSLNGSTSMEKVVGILSEQFMLDNPSVTVTYDATGSGTGISAAQQSTCDIGLASRALKDAEIGLTAVTVALDGIAVIVNRDCGVEDLTVAQIADIFIGKATNWSEVGDADLPIACIGREAGFGLALTVALYVYALERGDIDTAFAIASVLMALTLLLNLAANTAATRLRNTEHKEKRHGKHH